MSGGLKLKRSQYIAGLHFGLLLALGERECKLMIYFLGSSGVEKTGKSTYINQEDCLKMTGMKLNTFRLGVNSLINLGLVSRWHNQQGNKVFYSLNEDIYEDLITILSLTNDLKELNLFCQKTFRKGRSINSITDDERQSLAFSRISSRNKYSYLLVDKSSG